MFEPSEKARVFALPIGCDFLSDFKHGLDERLRTRPPEAIAKVQIYVNTRRSQRRLTELYGKDDARFLPKISVLSDLANDPTSPLRLPRSASKLRRTLQLSQFVKALIAKEPSFAPQSAVFDLAQSLGDLLAEMQGEAVPFEALENLDVSNVSEHWDRARDFLRIIGQYWDKNGLVDHEDRVRKTAESFDQLWQTTPIETPVIIAGSTGSRGETSTFIKAVSKLPQGAVVLPGYDFDTTKSVWDALAQDTVDLDHPQAGFSKLLGLLSLNPSHVESWQNSVSMAPERNRAVSLALRPAPITDAWLTEGPRLSGLFKNAFEDVDLIEAETSLLEAQAIAVRLRKASEDKQSAVLISPDRTLTRQVEATLSRWGIVADDSAGKPLQLSAPGIFLRLTAKLLVKTVTPADFLTLLKHPLTHSAEEDRNLHLLRTRDLELKKIRGKGPIVDFDTLRSWASRKISDPHALAWVEWLFNIFDSSEKLETQPLDAWVHQHVLLSEELSRGPISESQGGLWEKEAGQTAFKVMSSLAEEAEYSAELTASEYLRLLTMALGAEEVREPKEANPLISVWGTLEARVQGAELVILGGLNEGVWPGETKADPWLNRSMRKQLGLLTPDRNIGLAAHDFQQAIGAPQVVLSRALRDQDAPTVASRWLIRLLNLLSGLGDETQAILQDMRTRGQYWVALANQLDLPSNAVNPEPRPAPAPPVQARPRQLWATRITKLISDPFEIYARHVLHLKKLDDLNAEPDALARGVVLHAVLEAYCDQPSVLNQAEFLEFADTILEAKVPWPSARRVWRAKLARFANWYLPLEAAQREARQSVHLEAQGHMELPDLNFTLSAKADRIDISAQGALLIDYKSGEFSSITQVEKLDKQLPLTALIIQAGGFEKFGAVALSEMAYISFKDDGVMHVVPVKTRNTNDLLQDTRAGLETLIQRFDDPLQGYTARDRPKHLNDRYVSDYEHLSRFGEWRDSNQPVLVVLK